MGISFDGFSAGGFKVIEHMPLPIFVMGVVGGEVTHILFANSAMAEAVHVPLHELIGHCPADFFAKRRALKMSEHLRECVRTVEPVVYETMSTDTDGDRHLSITLSPASNDRGAITHIIGVAQDITAKRQWEVDQAHKHSMLRKRMSDLTLFSSVAAHDLRSPMCQLDLILQMIVRDFQDLGDGKVQLLGTSQEVISKAINYLDEVLQYCRDTIEEPAASAQVAFGQLCQDLSILLDPHARHAIRFPALTLECDRAVLQIAIRNLIDNAIKHNKNTRLEIAVDVRDAKGGWLIFTISDNGKGMDGIRKGLETESGQTTGFGLKGVRQLLGARSGTLRICDNDKAPGAKVMFSMPGRIVDRASRPIAGRASCALRNRDLAVA